MNENDGWGWFWFYAAVFALLVTVFAIGYACGWSRVLG